MASTPRRAPLAGKPPFATDDDDSIFDNPPAARPRQPKPKVEDRALSTYNAYDQYFDGNDAGKRDSGAAFGVGMGLMGDMSDDSDDEDDRRAPARTGNGSPNGKNRALYEAATRAQQPTAALVPNRYKDSPAASSNFDEKKPRSPSPPEYTPRNETFETKARPGPSMTITIPDPTSRTLSPMPAPVAQHAAASPSRPVPAFMMHGPPGSPVPSNTPYPQSPHPLPPSTPITPLFAAPPASFHIDGKVAFSPNTSVPIMRGGSEDAPLARPRPRKDGKPGGDDFWRRFSMVAHASTNEKSRNSSWLEKTRSGGRGFSRCVWVVGVTLLLAIGAGIGLGWYFTHNNPGHQDPIAIGGSASQGMNAPSSAAATTATGAVRTTHAAAAATTTAAKAKTTTSAADDVVARDFGAELDGDFFEAFVPAPTDGPIAAHHRRGRAKFSRLL